MQTQIEGATNGSVADILLEGVVGESAPTEPLLSAETPDEQVPALTPDSKPEEEVEGATPAAKPDKQPAYREAQLPDGTTIKIKNHWTTNWMPYRLRKETDKATAKFVSLLRRYQDKSWLDAEGKIDYGRVPWPIVLEMGYGNLGKSTQKNMSDMWDMVMHPVQTIDMLKDLASQTASKGFESWLRAMEPEKTEGWKGFDTPMFDMLIEVYKQNYDLEDNQSGLKQYIINEPASFLEDIATVSTLFLAGTGFATKGIQSTGSALKLTQQAKQLLKFNKYYDTRIGRAAGETLDAVDHLWQQTPNLINAYGVRAYYIGTGIAEGGYPPGFWAKLAHQTLNYMDITGAPIIAASSALSGSMGIFAGKGDLKISQGEFDNLTEQLFENFHPEFKGKGGSVGREEALRHMKTFPDLHPFVPGYDFTDLDINKYKIRYLPMKDGEPAIAKYNLSKVEIQNMNDSQRQELYTLIEEIHGGIQGRTFHQTDQESKVAAYIKLTDDEIDLIKESLPRRQSTMVRYGDSYKIEELPDEVLHAMIPEAITLAQGVEYVPHIYVGSAEKTQDFVDSINNLFHSTATTLDDNIAKAEISDMIDNGDAIALSNLSVEQLSEYGVRSKDDLREFFDEATIAYIENKPPPILYDEAMATYRQKLKRFEELEKYIAESGITYPYEMHRRLAERGDLRNLNLSDMIVDSHPASDILENFQSYQSGTKFGDKFGDISQLAMSSYYRHTAKFLDELDDPFESLKIHAPTSNNMDMDNKIRLGRLIRDIEKLHDISKTANQHLEGLEESIATQMREVALKHQADPSQGADAIRALLLQRQHFYNLANDSLPENSRLISITQILYQIEALESLLRSNAMIEMDVMMEGHNLLNALYLDYFENIENVFKPTYKHEDSLYMVFLEFQERQYTPPANSPLTTANVFESNYLMRDEYAINEAIQRWNQGVDIDEFIDYVQNESSSAWLQKFESELEDNLHLSEDLEKLQSMKDEVSEITKNSVEAKELINSTTKLTDATIENTLVNAINKLDLYQFKPFHRQFIDYLFFDDNTDRITRIMNRIKPQNRGSLQRDIFYELLNRSRKWDGKYLRTANRNEVPFWKHSQDYELGHFIDDIAKSHEFSDTSIEFMGGADSVSDVDFNNHVARFDNRLLSLLHRKYLPEDIIDWILDQGVQSENLKRGTNIYEIEDPKPVLKILRDIHINKFSEGDIQGILDSIQEPGTTYYDTIPYERQIEDLDHTTDLPKSYHRIWRTGAPGGGLFTVKGDLEDAAQYRHDNVARSKDLVLLIMEGEHIGEGIPAPTVEAIIKPTELISVAPFEWGDAWTETGVTPIGPALAMQIELARLGGNDWLTSIWEPEMVEHITDLAKVYDSWEGYKGSDIPETLNPRYSDEPGTPMELTAEEAQKEQKLHAELERKRTQQMRDAEDIIDQVESSKQSHPELTRPGSMWTRTYGIEVECFVDLQSIDEVHVPTYFEETQNRVRAAARQHGISLDEAIDTFDEEISDELYGVYAEQATQHAESLGIPLGEARDEFLLNYMENPNIVSDKGQRLQLELKAIHPDILIETDGSLRAGSTGYSPIEVKLPIMEGEEQMELVHSVYRVLNNYGMWVNQSAGLHVHIGKGDLSAPEIANLTKAHATYETSIDTLHHPSRQGNISSYARSRFRFDSDRNTIAEHLIRKYDGDMDEIQEYIELNYYTTYGEHLADKFSGVDDAIDYIERYKEKRPENISRRDERIIKGLEKLDENLKQGLTRLTGRTDFIFETHREQGRRFQKLNLWGKDNKTLEFRQAAATTDPIEAASHIRFALNFVERFRNRTLKPRKPGNLATELLELDPYRYPMRNDVLKNILQGSDNMPTIEEVHAWDLDYETWYVVTNESMTGEVGSVMPAKQTLLDVYDLLMNLETDLAHEIKVVRGTTQKFINEPEMGGLFSEINIEEIIDEFDVPNYGEEHFALLPDNLPPEVERAERAILFQVKNGGGINLQGVKLKNHAQMAALAQSYRNPSIETTRVFYVKKGVDGGSNRNLEIVGHKGMHLGSPSQTSPGSIDSVRNDMERLEADGIIVLHNHPDGDPTFSVEDRASAQNFKDEFGFAYIGEVVINSGKFSSEWQIGSQGGKPWYELVENEYLTTLNIGWAIDELIDEKSEIGLLYNQKTKRQKKDPLYKPTLDNPKLREIWDRHVPDNAEVMYEDAMNLIMEFGNTLKTEKNWITLAMVNNNNELMAVVDYSGLHELSHTELKRVIREQSVKYGGEQVHIFVGDGDWYDNELLAYKKFFQDDQGNFDPDIVENSGIATFSVNGEHPFDVGFETGESWQPTRPVQFERRFPSKKQRIQTGTKFINDAFSPDSALSTTMHGLLAQQMFEVNEFSMLELSFNMMGDQMTFDLLGAGGIELILKHIPKERRGIVRTWLTQYRRALSKLGNIREDDE